MRIHSPMRTALVTGAVESQGDGNLHWGWPRASPSRVAS
jgi:hypothetical protein